jgi:hypothetical protein
MQSWIQFHGCIVDAELRFGVLALRLSEIDLHLVVYVQVLSCARLNQAWGVSTDRNPGAIFVLVPVLFVQVDVHVVLLNASLVDLKEVGCKRECDEVKYLP